MATSQFASPRMLDTNALFELIRDPQGIRAQRLNAQQPDTGFTSIVAARAGPIRSNTNRATISGTLPG